MKFQNWEESLESSKRRNSSTHFSHPQGPMNGVSVLKEPMLKFQSVQASTTRVKEYWMNFDDTSPVAAPVAVEDMLDPEAVRSAASSERIISPA
jgi:hypothetical protein